MRAILVSWLIGLLILCPQLCGGVESDQSAHQADVSHGHDGPAPAHCPGDGDDCICQGAVPVDQARVPHAVLIDPTPHFTYLGESGLKPVGFPLNDQALKGLAHWGSPLAIRAVLQNFRC